MIYPSINPVALDLGLFKLYWYGVMYLLAFLSAYLLAKYRSKSIDNWNSKMTDDLIFYGAIGVVAGGRIGYMVFYNLSGLLSDPLSLFLIQNYQLNIKI